MNFERVIERNMELQKEDRWKRIRESKYNKWYGWVKEEGMPDYMKKEWGKSRWKREARYRLRNEMRDGGLKE